MKNPLNTKNPPVKNGEKSSAVLKSNIISDIFLGAAVVVADSRGIIGIQIIKRILQALHDDLIHRSFISTGQTIELFDYIYGNTEGFIDRFKSLFKFKHVLSPLYCYYAPDSNVII
mgnify:CR=1 FL=1